MDFKIKPRSEVEQLVTKFVVDNKIYAEYCKDTEGLFIVRFLVEEEIDAIDDQPLTRLAFNIISTAGKAKT